MNSLKNLKACTDMDSAFEENIYNSTQLKTKRNQPLTQFEISKKIIRNLHQYQLSPVTKLVLLALIDRLPNVFPSQKTLSEQLGVSIASVKRAISELRKQGLVITTESKYKSLNYKFTSNFIQVEKNSKANPKNSSKNFDKNKLIPPTAQNNTLTGIKMSHKETNEEKNKKPFLLKNLTHSKNQTNINTKKINFFPQPVINYKKFTPKPVKIGSPLDYTKEQAIEYLNNLPNFLTNTKIANQLKQKWNI